MYVISGCGVALDVASASSKRYVLEGARRSPLPQARDEESDPVSWRGYGVFHLAAPSVHLSTVCALSIMETGEI